jgi:hypothetical protein
VLQGLTVFGFDEAIVDAALSAAAELGWWEAARAPISVEELTRGLDARRGRLLVELLCSDGAMALKGDRVCAVAPRTGRPMERAGIGRMAEVVQSGVPLSLEDHAAQLHDHLWRAGEAAGRELWARLCADGLGPGLLLDAGGGAGAYSSAWLESSPAARAHLVDRGPVAAMAREKLARFGDRARVSEGEIDAVSGAHDVGLLCNVLHLYAPAVCERLVARVAAAVRPGGTVVVKDAQIAADRSGPRAALAFALTLALYGDGDVYGEAELRGWLERAGVREVRSLLVGDQIVLSGIPP